jgi:hypothetical protein
MSYKDPFTLDGRIRHHHRATEAKVRALQTLMEDALAGDIIADARLREAISSTDAVFSLPSLLNLQFIPQLPEKEKDLAVIAPVRTAKDFNPITLLSMISGHTDGSLNESNLKGSALGVDGALPPIPEGTPYPMVTIGSGQESFYQKITKYGVRLAYTWEARIQDSVGFLDGLPAELLATVVDTRYSALHDALALATTSAGAYVLPNGITVPDNAKLIGNSANVLAAASMALGERTINGRPIGDISSFNLFVAVGKKKKVEWDLERARATVQIIDGSEVKTPPPSLVPDVTIIESPRYTGDAWKLVPKPGTTKGRPVLEQIRLRGYENPELRVLANTGDYIGGGKVSPFEGSFSADTIDLRLRLVSGAALWDAAWIVSSTGAN